MFKYMHNIRHLRAFLAVAKYRSINRATESVFLSQPAITQALAKIEIQLNTLLFTRKSDGMYLTHSGFTYQRRAQRGLAILQQGIKDALRLGNARDNSRAKQLLGLITTTQLRALVAVASAKNFSIAGRNIGVSQSSLHRSCRDLESLLAVPLFKKTTQGISLSQAALVLSKASNLAFFEIEQGKEEVYALQNKEIGHLRIGCMPLLSSDFLPNSILQFTALHPAINISISDGHYDNQLHDLRCANIDILVGALRSPYPSDDIAQEHLFSSEVVVVARAEHPLCRKTQITIDTLLEYAWVIPQLRTPTRKIFEQLFHDQITLSNHQLIEASSPLIMRSLLEQSDRLTLVSALQVNREINQGTLKVLPIRLPNTARPIGIAYRKEWQPTKTQQAMLNILREQVTQYQHL